MNGRDCDDGYPAVVCRLPAADKAGVEWTGPIAGKPAPTEGRSSHDSISGIGIRGSWLASDSVRSVTACIAGTPHNDLDIAGRVWGRLAGDADDADDADDEGAALTATGRQWSRQAALLKGPANRFQPSPGDHCEQTRCPSTWLSQRNQGAAAAWA